MWLWKRKPRPAAVAAGLRERIFTSMPGDVGVTSAPGHERVWAVLMETGYPEAVASVVAIADGTTSLYFSNGGGIIGAGERPAVRDASNAFLALADAHASALGSAQGHPLPSVGRVRFYARTFTGTLTAEAGESELGSGEHELSPLFFAAHAVISAIREATPEGE